MQRDPFLNFRRLGIGIVVLALGWLGTGRLAGAETIPAVDDRWQHFRTPNFEMYSKQGEKASRDLLHDLEVLRAVFIERFKMTERARLEVTIYAFRTTAEFREYLDENLRRSETVRGYYLARPDRAVIVLAPMEDSDASRRVIFHEYVHHLFRAGEEEPPLWFGEGMAEVLGSIRETRGKIEIGRPQAGWLLQLRFDDLMPLSQLFSSSRGASIYASDTHTGKFYAQAWALLHFWYFGKSGLPRDGVDRFLAVAGDEKRAGETDLRALFQECFGMDYPEMEKRLQRYVREGTYGYSLQPVPVVDDRKTYPMRAVPRDEIRVRLAELGLRATQSSAAKLVLLEATEKHPTDPRPFEALGSHALLAEQDENLARQRWEQAIEVGTKNVAIFRELGLMESRTWFSRFDFYFRLPEQTAERLRMRLRRSIEQDPQQTAGYEMLAWVEAFSEKPVLTHVNLVQQRFSRLKQQDRTLLALALVRIRLGREDEGFKLIEQLEKGNRDPWTKQAIEVVRARLDRPREEVKANERETQVEVNAEEANRHRLRVPSVQLPRRN